MGRLERRQAGAVSTGALGMILLLAGVVATLIERGGMMAPILGCVGAVMLLIGMLVNARIASEIMKEGRR